MSCRARHRGRGSRGRDRDDGDRPPGREDGRSRAGARSRRLRGWRRPRRRRSRSGADGVLLGTRFMARRVRRGRDYKDDRRGNGEDTISRQCLDSLCGRDWPAHGRGPAERVRRGVARAGTGVTASAQAVRARLEPAGGRGHEYWLMWFGQSVGLVDSVRPAGESSRDCRGGGEILRELSRMLEPSGYNERRDAGWSSQVARRAHNPEVAGSNPAPAIDRLL